MSIDDVYCWLKKHEACFLPSCAIPDHQFGLRLILAWIHAEARAREAEFWHGWYETELDGEVHPDRDKERWSHDDWLAAVKAEVGWPQDGE